jgi:hypothetical protein
LKHFASSRYWARFDALPAEVQKLATRNFELLKQNPQHPSLRFKSVGKFRSVRVGLHYRALGVAVGDDVQWFWIGSHAEYDKLVG